MMNYDINKKQYPFKFILVCTLLFSLLLVPLINSKSISAINFKDTQVNGITSIVSIINYLLAVISSVHYYKLKKNDEIIFYIVYFAIAFLVNLLVLCPIGDLKVQNRLLFLFIYLYPVSMILIIISILPSGKFESMTNKKKNTLMIIVGLILVFLCFLETIFYNMFYSNLKMIIICLLFYGVFVLNYASIVNLKRFKIKHNYLNILLSYILFLNSIRYISILIFIFSNFKLYKFVFLAVIFKLIIIPMYSITLFCISNINISNKIKDIQQLDTFYNILDQTLEKEIYFLVNGNEIIYTNKKGRKSLGVNEYEDNYIKEVNEKYNEISKHISEEDKRIIDKSLKENRNWLGVIHIDNGEERVVEITEDINEIYGKILVIMVSSNKELIELRKELEEKNRIFEVLTKRTGDLMGIVDKEYNLKYVNDEVCKVLGYEIGDVTGIKIGDLFADAQNSDFDVKEKTILELQLICKNGDTINVETLVTPNEEGWIVSSRNVAYKRQMQLLKEENESIKLHQELKNDFFANLSHELRTPLNIFSSIIQILDINLKKDSEEFKAMYEKYNKGLKNNVYRMIRMVTNLIDLTKIDSDFAFINFKNYDIVNLCEVITLSIIPYAEQKNINIIFDTEEEEYVIKSDGECMERIMLNLLSNAIKYTQSNGKIVVNLNFDDKYVYISVKDNGIGIPKEKQKSIFEKFVRVDKSLRRQNEGSGIGLSIVKSLVELIGGSIYVKSEENVGSEFIIKLPNEKLDGGVNIYTIDEQNITLELSDIYEVL